jgi:thiol-disulfide isomerase/thioredoxin
MSGKIDHRRRTLFRVAGMTIAATQLGLFSSAIAKSSKSPLRSPIDALPALDNATAWFNSKPLSVAGLRGKVVLINFWTYSCINWLRTLPYIRAWANTYKNQGLVVIGVHSPEFAFEKELGNVRHATQAMRLDYPIAVDSEHSLWRTFRNEYWPALYLADSAGRIRYYGVGEGEYAQTEKEIQKLLSEAGLLRSGQEPVSVDAHGVEAPADWLNLKSPENYVGYERTENFASTGGVSLDQPRVYAAPARLMLNHWALSGDWTVSKESIVLNLADGRIVYRFHARDLHLVMGPVTGGEPVRFRVSIDGQQPGAIHGIDIDEHGAGIANEPRLYQLVRQTKQPIADRQFDIVFLDHGVQAFSFTFG